jgi:hypothetical protein
MESVAETERPAVQSRGFQVSLRGLMVLVLAAGVAAGAVRSAREVWGSRLIPPSGMAAGTLLWASGEVPIERTAGVALEIVAVFLLVVLARALIGVLRGSARSADRQARRIRAWAIAWRAGAACFLLWFISAESQLLRIDLVREAEISTWVPGWTSIYRVHQSLLPACGLFATLGLLLGSGASFLLPATPRRRRRPYWLFVVLAGVAAVLIAANNSVGGLITSLVLVALEAVNNAMYHAASRGSGLWTRMLHAGIDAAISAGMCLALAVAVARDFEMLRRRNPQAASHAGRVMRLLLLVGAAAAGFYVAAVTFPAIHPWFAQGFRQVLGPAEAAMIAGCFSLFGAGMAARAIAGATEQQPSRWTGRLRAFYGLSILGVILFAALNILPDSSVLEPYAPRFVTSTVVLIKEGVARFWEQFPDSFTTGALRMLAIENLLWTSLILATMFFVIELLIRDNPRLDSPFDRLAESPERVRQFVWLVSGFVVVCLAALPTLIVASQVLILLRLVGGDMRTGWAN